MGASGQKLKLGKGARFVKSHLRRLPLHDDVWEADFQPEADCWIGIVVEQQHGFVLSEKVLETAADVNDLAGILSDAMRRPLVELQRHRPGTIQFRDNPTWRELVPHLEDLGINVVFHQELVHWEEVANSRPSILKTLWLELRNDSPRGAGNRITIIPAIHGKRTRDGKISEPDIHWILEKWLDRHPKIKSRERDIRVRSGNWTTADGLRTEVVSATIIASDDLVGYDPGEDTDLYEYFLAEDRYWQDA